VIDAMDVGDGYPMDPPPAWWRPMEFPLCRQVSAGSASWQATAQRPQRRRWDLATAGLAGAVAALLILRAVDRRG
jgi:hypothetical protein